MKLFIQMIKASRPKAMHVRAYAAFVSSEKTTVVIELEQFAKVLHYVYKLHLKIINVMHSETCKSCQFIRAYNR